jgi:hypothetical protein
MYVTSENVWTSPGVGTVGAGQLGPAQACLQSITVTATCLSAITGTPTINLDLQFGDNQNPNLGQNADTTFASNAVTAVVAPPLTLNASASAVVLVGGCVRAARINIGGTLSAGQLKVQVAARDIN